ncbi:MAG: hypothetical protein GEU74_12485 [Nitriliruptorales bacterium]|nr:hypothetical protein [Nitriliruptorales bacterium]
MSTQLHTRLEDLYVPAAQKVLVVLAVWFVIAIPVSVALGRFLSRRPSSEPLLRGSPVTAPGDSPTVEVDVRNRVFVHDESTLDVAHGWVESV